MSNSALPHFDIPVPNANGERPSIANLQFAAAPPARELVAHVNLPVSAVMAKTLWLVHAEDSIARVEDILAEHGLTSAPVLGSNGAIVGMIGAAELAQFHGNAKAVQAWEISRINVFEVSPGDSVGEVAKLMSENKIETIAVTDCGRLQGVVSTQDLLQEILKVLPEESSN